MVAFNVGLLLPSSSSVRFYFEHSEHEIVPASHFARIDRNPAEFHNKVIVGRLLSITTPNQQGTYLGQTTSVSSGQTGAAGQRGRYQTVHRSSAVLIILADLYDSPNCCAIFLPRKQSFQNLFGSNTRLSETARIGDVFAVKDPAPSDERLGDSIVVLKQPRIVAACSSHGWPETQMVTSSAANWQVYFDETGKRIEIHGPHLIHTGDSLVGCGGFTCDRQKHCKGCYGKETIQKAIVFRCDVNVVDAPHFSGGRAFFPGVCSLRLGRLFFVDLDGLSGKQTTIIDRLLGVTEAAVATMVTHVNDHGGWRVCGWHRQGMRTERGTGEEILNARTKGHITLLEPTNPDIINTEDFKALQVPTPVDERVPAVPQVAMPALPARGD